MDAQTKSLITDLRKFLQEVKQDKPDLEWCCSYETMRKKLPELRLYQFCPAYFEEMLRLMCERIEKNKDVSQTVLKYIRAWLNKSRGYKAGPFGVATVQHVDLKEVFGSRYASIANALFILFSTYIFDRKRSKLVKSLIANVELKPAHQLWLTNNWHKDDAILQKLIAYPFPSDIISAWTSDKGLHEGALLPNLSGLVAHVISSDTEFLLTIRHVKKLMSTVHVLWHALNEIYHEEIKDRMEDEPFNWDNIGAIKNFEEYSQSKKSAEVSLLDCLEANKKIHPSFYHSVEYFFQLVYLGLQFRLYPNAFGKTHLSVGHHFDFEKPSWVAFEIDTGDFLVEGYPKQTCDSVRNFFRIFPYINIDATVEEWHAKARRIRDVQFYKGIYKSTLSQQKKNELYKRYFTTELQFVLYDFIKWEKNTEMAEWLKARLEK